MCFYTLATIFNLVDKTRHIEALDEIKWIDIQPVFDVYNLTLSSLKYYFWWYIFLKDTHIKLKLILF